MRMLAPVLGNYKRTAVIGCSEHNGSGKAAATGRLPFEGLDYCCGGVELWLLVELGVLLGAPAVPLPVELLSFVWGRL
jgi:hypothetical protein